MVKNIFLNILIFLFISLNIFSQQVGTWVKINEFIEPYYSNGLWYRGISNQVIDKSNNDDFVVISRDTTGLSGTNKIQPTVLLSTNFGENWEIARKDTSDIGLDFISISHPSKNIIIVTGDTLFNESNIFRSFLLISIDAGRTWNKTFLDSNSVISYLNMQDSLNGTLIKWTTVNNTSANIDIRDSIYITKDCWESWYSIVTPSNIIGRTYQVIYFDSINFVIFGKPEDEDLFYVWCTKDGGVNWEKSASNQLLDNPLFYLKFKDKKNVWLLGSKPNSIFWSTGTKLVLLKSSDGGINWEENYVDTTYPGYSPDLLCDINFSDDENGILVGNNGRIYRTKDGGKNWLSDFLKFQYPISNNWITNIFTTNDKQFIFGSFSYLHYNVLYKYNSITTLSPPYIFPVDNLERPDSVTIKWKKVVGANSYKIQIGGGKNISNIYADSLLFENAVLDTIVNDTFLIVKTLNYNSRYIVRAKAYNDFQESDWYTRQELIFKTLEFKGQLWPLNIIYPYIYSSDIPVKLTVKWEKIDSATFYQIKVYREGFYPQYLIYQDSMLTDTTYNLPDSLEYDKIYGIQVYYNIVDSLSLPAQTIFKTEKNITNIIISSDINHDLYFRAFPNPFISDLNIEFTDNNSYILELYDLLGTRKFSLKNENSRKLIVDTSFLPKGIYFIKVYYHDKIKVLKIIKSD